MEKQRVLITITGWVQGVGYRYWALHSARAIGVKGYVKNQAEGVVYVDAEADRVQLNAFIKACYDGPSRARVSQVDTLACTELKNYQLFEIR